jgi:hypothetical protein
MWYIYKMENYSAIRNEPLIPYNMDVWQNHYAKVKEARCKKNGLFFFFSVLGIKPRASGVLGKCLPLSY